jgi:hypothetical protein
MRIEATATSLTWIPPQAVEGIFKLPFNLGISHYDAPPPDELRDVDALVSADAIRFANQLSGWIDVEDGRVIGHGAASKSHFGTTRLRVGPFGAAFAAVQLPDLRATPEVDPNHVRFTQTSGGYTGVAVPRRVRHAPFWRLSAPIAWTTLALTIRVDGSSSVSIDAASPFPRHYLYDTQGNLLQKTGLIRYSAWIAESQESDTPWGGVSNPPVLVDVNSRVERAVANTALMEYGYVQHKLAPGDFLRDSPISESRVHLLLDGILVIELDEHPVGEVGPGAILDPSLRIALSKQHARIRARTPCRLAVIDRHLFEKGALQAAAREQATRLEASWLRIRNNVRRVRKMSA